MLIRNTFIIALFILLIGTAVACLGPNANSSNSTSPHNSTGSPAYSREQVIEIAMAFSPECREKIPPKEGEG